jgi:hypothetical protein
VRTKVAVVKLRATAEILMVDAITFVSLDPDVCDVSLCLFYVCHILNVWCRSTKRFR